MQLGGANSTIEPAGAPIAAPLEAAWDSIRTGLRRDLGARTFDGWLKPAELGAFEPDSGALDVVMPSQFMADWVRSHFGERLTLPVSGSAEASCPHTGERYVTRDGVCTIAE